MKTVLVKSDIDNQCLQFGNVEKILVCSTDFILVMSNGTENRFIKPFYSYEVIEDDGTTKTAKELQTVIKEKDAEIERLKKVIDSFTDIGKLYSEIKADAISLFAERLKGKAKCDYYGDDILYTMEIDNLVKEMVGEEWWGLIVRLISVTQ